MKKEMTHTTMRTLIALFFLSAIALFNFSSCNDDDGFSDEDMAYFRVNEEYIQKMKAEKDEDGNPVYKVIEWQGETVLYKVFPEDVNIGEKPIESSTVTVDLKGELIDGKIFQPEITNASFSLSRLIKGVALVLLETHLNETVKAIVPATLGYGYYDNKDIRGGSTLIFNMKLTKIE